jgi:DNA-binding XRE family transcriptional regulator
MISLGVQQKQFVKEAELAALAKAARVKSQLSKAELGRRLGVTRGAIHQAEEHAETSLTKVRVKMIEKCTSAKISGPFYQIET